MHSDISEFVLTGFEEPLFIRNMESGGAGEVIIYQEASIVHLSWTVITPSLFFHLFVSNAVVKDKGVVILCCWKTSISKTNP